MSLVEIAMDMAMLDASHQKNKTPIDTIVKEYNKMINAYKGKIENYKTEIQELEYRIASLKGSISKWESGEFDDIVR